MAAPVPFQSELLLRVERSVRQLVADANGRYDRLDLLEGVACAVAGLPIAWYAETSPWPSNATSVPASEIEVIRELLDGVPIPLPFSLAVIAVPPPEATAQKKAGVYYTDFRLAEDLVDGLGGSRSPGTVVDLACGTGVLLVASLLQIGGSDQSVIDQLLETGIHGVDLDCDALRGSALSLTSAASTTRAVDGLRAHLYQMDSLRASGGFWKAIAPGGFDAVVGNPPWERLRFSRHEHLLSKGETRLYGESYSTNGAPELEHARLAARELSADLKSNFRLQDRGESDLYKLFLEVALDVVHPEGRILQLVPAGLIRSQGATALRDAIMERSAVTRMRIYDNKARYFAIDSRFKFLTLDLQLPSRGQEMVPMLILGNRTSSAVDGGGDDVEISADELRRLRTDLTVPEVRTREEWVCFNELSAAGSLFDSDGGWDVTFHRELDMTNNRDIFRPPVPGLLPVIEGRMVHQYRHDWKTYRGGEGRAALWEPVARSEACKFGAQFACALEDLPSSTRQRSQVVRFGFCDITGQTNQRTLLASLIPAGVVCGNKVPTLTFGGVGSVGPEQMGLLWLALANSFSVDWMVRRLTTTTLNFFVLRSVPLPRLVPSSAEATDLINLARVLSACSHMAEWGDRTHGWRYAELRAEVEWRVWAAYGQDFSALDLILSDFPMLDRGQRALEGEQRSTITRDLVRLRAAENLGASAGDIARLQERVERARAFGSVPFLAPRTPESRHEVELIADTA